MLPGLNKKFKEHVSKEILRFLYNFK